MAKYKLERVGRFDIWFDTFRHCYVIQDGTEFVASCDSFSEVMDEINEIENQEGEHG